MNVSNSKLSKAAFPILVGILALLAILLLTRGPALLGTLTPNLYRYAPGAKLSYWTPTLQSTTNAFFMWRVDPLVASLLNFSFLTLSQQIVLTLLAEILIFACPLFFIIRQNSSPLKALLATLLSITGYLLFFGLDNVTLAGIAWLPLLFLLLERCQLSKTPWPWAIASLFVSLRHIQTANQMGLLTLVITLIWFLRQHRSSISFSALMISLLSLCVCLFQTIRIPQPPRLDYPASGFTRPFFSSYGALDSIDRAGIRELFAHSALLILAASLLLLLLSWNRSIRNSAAFLCLAALILVADVRLAEEISVMSPLETLRRLLPEAFFFSFTPLMTMLCLIAICCLIAQLGRAGALAGLTLLAVLFVWQRPEHLPVLQNAHARNLTRAAYSTADQNLKTLLTSPSFKIINQQQIAFHDLDRPSVTWHTLSDNIQNLTSSVVRKNPNSKIKLESKLINGSTSTYWRAGKLAGENAWIALELKSPLNLRALRLLHDPSLRLKHSIITVFTADSCNLKDPAWQKANDWTLIGTANPALAFTKAGYPYSGTPEEVSIFFKRNTLTACLLINNSATNARDWSISEIEVALASEP